MAETEVPLNDTNPVSQPIKLVSRKNLSSELKADASPVDVVDFIINKSADELIPWEKCSLPSKGLFYGGKIPDGTIEVRPMTIAVDKILATSRLAQSGQAIEKMYEKCVRLPSGFEQLDLLIGDRTFLLFYIRGITHGNGYEFIITCSNDACKQKSTHEYDLNHLWDKVRPSRYTSEPIRIKLPYFSEEVGREVWADVRFLRQRDIQVINRRAKIRQAAMPPTPVRDKNTNEEQGQNNSNYIDNAIEENLNLAITSINGVTDQIKIASVVKRMHSKDSAIVREVINFGAPGIDTEILVTCPHCNEEMKVDLPISENFFRPKESHTV